MIRYKQGFTQGKKVRDYIFPIVAARKAGDHPQYFATGFMVGNQGYALTALHVVEHIKEKGLSLREGPCQGGYSRLVKLGTRKTVPDEVALW